MLCNENNNCLLNIQDVLREHLTQTLMLQRRKLRSKEVMWLAQGPIVSEWQNTPSQGRVLFTKWGNHHYGYCVCELQVISFNSAFRKDCPNTSTHMNGSSCKQKCTLNCISYIGFSILKSSADITSWYCTIEQDLLWNWTKFFN